MADLRNILVDIRNGDLNNDDLSLIIEAVKFARKQLAQTAKRDLKIGDNVNFTSTKTGQNVTGMVTKIAIKYVTVRTVNGLWRVPANMLTRIEDSEFA
jgi:small-conductance mechanosensitive channel